VSAQRQGGRTHVVDAAARAEATRLAILFLVSSVTLLLLLTYAAAYAVRLDVVPGVVILMWRASLISGVIATWAYGAYVTIRARRWLWAVLCLVPFTAVPCSLAYAWIRRGELEAEIEERVAQSAK
jgi:hypothetical protein